MKYSGLGDFFQRYANSNKALLFFEECNHLIQSLIHVDANNSEFKHDLIISYYKLAEFYKLDKKLELCLENYNLAIDTLIENEAQMEKETVDNMLLVLTTEKEKISKSLKLSK